MVILQEKSLSDFAFWSQALEHANCFTEKELDEIDYELSKLYPDGIDEIDLNDIFRFEPEYVASLIGEDWEEISTRN